MNFIPDKMVPLVYFVFVAAAAVIMHKVGVPEPVNGIITGAGLTRVKMPAPGKEQNVQVQEEGSGEPGKN